MSPKRAFVLLLMVATLFGWLGVCYMAGVLDLPGSIWRVIVIGGPGFFVGVTAAAIEEKL